MSIIEKSNPLNLQYRVCVVTSAATPLGVIVCKTLLKANALVLGIDSRPKDHSLNAGLGTHFQFEECSVDDKSTPERIVEAARKKFGFERIDALVNIVEEGKEGDLEGLAKLSEVVGQGMAQDGRGSIINVVGNMEAEEEKFKPAIGFTKDMAAQFRKRATSAGDHHSADAYEEARTHMTALMKTEKIAKDVPSASESRQTAAKFYDVGNLTLFLAGDMSESVSGAAVSLDGSYLPL
ncbi:hypothetical protein LTR85_008896 [Meristemomyces frigidus]|nr:hypothetical protein LTR85_008896 [Meristemomyces frigidus]